MKPLKIVTDGPLSQAQGLVMGDDERLTSVLSRHGMGLNTRCGEKGYCNGCEVFVGTETQPRKACQQHGKDLWDGATVRIPERSLGIGDIGALDDFILRGSPEPDSSKTGLGLAIDVGTTTLAVLLADLSTGEILARVGARNPQGRFGDNVMTRIEACASDPQAATAMQKALLQEGIAPLIRRVLHSSRQSSDAITTAMVAGNPTMLHLFAGENPAPLGTYPFKPVFLETRVLRSEQLGLDGIFPVTLLPSFGPFVGADLSAGTAATGMLCDTTQSATLLVDVGTNGEIVLQANGQLYAAATAAGPAFEGGRLRYGTFAGPGAITHIRMTEEGCVCQGYGGKSPRQATGLCGSAYISFMAEALRTKRLSPTGRFNSTVDLHVEDGIRGMQLLAGQPLGVYESDIAELLQAKAAIAAGILTLLNLAGITPRDISKLYLGGGFGRHVDVADALQIGLLPGFTPEQIEVAGNTALGGAYLALLNDEVPTAMTIACARLQCIELNTCPEFEDYFLDCLTLEAIK